MWIFISHSTGKVDEAGKQRLLDLQAALKGPKATPSGHDVLLDFVERTPVYLEEVEPAE